MKFILYVILLLWQVKMFDVKKACFPGNNLAVEVGKMDL